MRPSLIEGRTNFDTMKSSTYDELYCSNSNSVAAAAAPTTVDDSKAISEMSAPGQGQKRLFRLHVTARRPAAALVHLPRSWLRRPGSAKETRSIARRSPPNQHKGHLFDCASRPAALPPLLFVSSGRRKGDSFDRASRRAPAPPSRKQGRASRMMDGRGELTGENEGWWHKVSPGVLLGAKVACEITKNQSGGGAILPPILPFQSEQK